MAKATLEYANRLRQDTRAGPGKALYDENFAFYVSLACAAAILAAIAWPMVLGQLYTLDDLSRYHIPMRAFFARALEAGRNYTWTPNVYCGYYVHGEGQVGMYHPLHQLLYRFLPFTEAFNLELFLSYPAMLAGMYFFLRRWGLRRDSSMFGGIAFAFCGFNLLHFIHMNAVATLAHVPWLLLAVDVYLRGPVRKRALVGLAVSLLTGSEVLLGYPQYVWFSAFVELLYVILLRPHWSGIVSLAGLAAFKAAGLLMGAVQLMPTWETLSNSERLTSPTYATDDLSLPPVNLFQLVAPYLFKDRVITNHPSANTHEYGTYDGAVPLVLFFSLLLVVRRLGDKRRLAWGAIVLAGISLVLSLGRYGVVYQLQRHLPLVGYFRAPSRYIALVHLAFAVGAAVAYDRLGEATPSGERASPRSLVIPAILPFASVVAILLAGYAGGPGARWAVLTPHAAALGVLTFLPTVLLIAAGVLVIVASRGFRPALAALVVLAAGDLAWYGLSYIRTSPPESLEAVTESVRLPVGASPYRIEAIPGNDDVAVLKDYRLVTGYVGLNPQKALDYTDGDALRLASATLVLWKPGTRGNPGDAAELRVERITDPVPRARLLTNALAVNKPQEMLSKVDLHTIALVGEPLTLDGGAPGETVLLTDEPGRIRVRAQSPGRQLLVVSESYHAGWRAAVDGQATKVIRVYGDFIGVVVEGGGHEAVFRFCPESLRNGAIASMAGFAGAFVLACLAAVRAQSRKNA